MKPSLGQVWTDGQSPGYAWLVEGIGVTSGIVYLALLHDGVRTRGGVDWPLNRWSAFVDKNRLTLADGDRLAA